MSAVIDQLRISDDGQKMYIDAHVNKASYFENVHLSKITICTEEQVSETNPYTYGDEFIYQKEIGEMDENTFTPAYETEDVLKPVTEKVQVLSGQLVLDELNENGGIPVDCTGLEDSSGNYLNLVLSGVFSSLDEGRTPRLVVASSNFNPATDALNSPEVLFTIDGEEYEEKGHHTWRFTGKGDVTDNEIVQLYLYRQDNEGEYTLVDIHDEQHFNEPRDLDPDEQYDYHFLHFLWQVWSQVTVIQKAEIHLVLTPSDMNLSFGESTFSKHIFFVYIECEGTPGECTPCRLDEQTTLGVTLDYGVIFNKGMSYSRELANTCDIPFGFTNFILNYDALKIAIETEHYIPAIDIWKRLLSDSGTGVGGITTNTCRCHG